MPGMRNGATADPIFKLTVPNYSNDVAVFRMMSVDIKEVHPVNASFPNEESHKDGFAGSCDAGDPPPIPPEI